MTYAESLLFNAVDIHYIAFHQLINVWSVVSEYIIGCIRCIGDAIALQEINQAIEPNCHTYTHSCILRIIRIIRGELGSNHPYYIRVSIKQWPSAVAMIDGVSKL